MGPRGRRRLRRAPRRREDHHRRSTSTPTSALLAAGARETRRSSRCRPSHRRAPRRVRRRVGLRRSAARSRPLRPLHRALLPRASISPQTTAEPRALAEEAATGVVMEILRRRQSRRRQSRRRPSRPRPPSLQRHHRRRLLRRWRQRDRATRATVRPAKEPERRTATTITARRTTTGTVAAKRTTRRSTAKRSGQGERRQGRPGGGD